MSATLRSAGLVAEADFLAMSETTRPAELLDGERIVPPSRTPGHQTAVMELAFQLHAWARSYPPARVMVAPLDLRLGPARIVQPDIMLWRDGMDEEVAPVDKLPDLVVEVLSQNRVHDRVTKRLLYGESGIGEYWIVDRAARRVEVCRGSALKMSTTEVRDFTSPMLPGLTVRLDPVFG